MIKLVRSISILLFALFLSLPAAQARDRESNCTWKGVTPQRIDVADAALVRDGDDRIQEIVKTQLPFGVPVDSGDGHGEHLLVQEYYIIWYDDDLRAPLWTAHRLTKFDVEKKLTRADSFRTDPRLDAAQWSECSDYKEPIFDQGHMVPNGAARRPWTTRF